MKPISPAKPSRASLEAVRAGVRNLVNRICGRSDLRDVPDKAWKHIRAKSKITTAAEGASEGFLHVLHLFAADLFQKLHRSRVESQTFGQGRIQSHPLVRCFAVDYNLQMDR